MLTVIYRVAISQSLYIISINISNTLCGFCHCTRLCCKTYKLLKQANRKENSANKMKRKYKACANFLGYSPHLGLYCTHGENILPYVFTFYIVQLSSWVLQFPTLAERQLFHYSAPNSAENIKVEYKVPPQCLGYICFLRMLIIHGTSDLHPLTPTHQTVTPINLLSNTQHPATQHPIP